VMIGSQALGAYPGVDNGQSGLLDSTRAADTAQNNFRSQPKAEPLLNLKVKATFTDDLC
jgi:hypothetical protein